MNPLGQGDIAVFGSNAPDTYQNSDIAQKQLYESRFFSLLENATVTREKAID